MLLFCLPTLNNQQSPVTKNGAEFRDNRQSRLPAQETLSCVELFKASAGLLLVLLFPLDNNSFQKNFTSIFKHDLNQFNGDVLFTVLSTQWHLLKWFDGPIWHEINIGVPFPPSEGPWLDIIWQIKEKAKAIGVSLIKKEEDDVNTSNFRLDPSKWSQDISTSSQTLVVTPASV